MRPFDILSQVLAHSAMHAHKHSSKRQQFYAERDAILDLEGVRMFLMKGARIVYPTVIKNKTIKIIAKGEVRVEVREGWRVVVYAM